MKKRVKTERITQYMFFRCQKITPTISADLEIKLLFFYEIILNNGSSRMN